MEKTRQLSKKDMAAANRFGGSDIKTWHEYYQPDGLGYCDKVAHFLRSIYWRQQIKNDQHNQNRQRVGR